MAYIQQSRWEWRTFCISPLDRVEKSLRRLCSGHRKEDADLYFIGKGDANVKVREDGVLDVKICQCRTEQGIEQWHPLFRCGFPASAEDMAVVARCLCLSAAPPPIPSNRELVQWLAEAGVRVVPVRKHRDIHVVENVIFETGTLSFGDRQLWTFCAESLDRAQVERVLKGFRLESEICGGYVELLQGKLKLN